MSARNLLLEQTDFDSKVERIAFPIIMNHALNKINQKFEYQKEIGISDINPQYAKYRIDFLLGSSCGLEIDGKKYHTNLVYEKKRDNDLDELGIHIIHIPAQEVFRRPKTFLQRYEWEIAFYTGLPTKSTLDEYL